MPKLKDLAKVIRSKNAGPFLVTMDVMFADAETYLRVKRTGVMSRELFSRLYSVPLDEVIYHEYDSAYSFKGTIPRVASCGDINDGDVYGAQQHAPLLDVEIPY